MADVGTSVPIPMPGQAPDALKKRGFLVKVETQPTDWSIFKLEDGTILKHKVVILNVYRVEGELDPEGYPVYVSQMANFIEKDMSNYIGTRVTEKGEENVGT